MNTALVLVDIQQDYFPKGKMEVVGAVEASRVASRLLGHFREKKLPVVHVQHISTRAGATFFLPDTEGINFHKGVIPLSNEAVIKKHFPNSFCDTDLQEHLESKGIKVLVICGMMSHMCIDATVRAAFDRGYICTVAHDACATSNLFFNGIDIPAMHVHGAYMAALGAVYSKVLSAEEIIGTL
ncbi:MAG TPA: cysteine hydrolase family protein [Dissulfurispiraceae bacterium]|nr:cysteine hydrolase family protein [Dissulfurispiraceae bacterium]